MSECEAGRSRRTRRRRGNFPLARALACLLVPLGVSCRDLPTEYEYWQQSREHYCRQLELCEGSFYTRYRDLQACLDRVHAIEWRYLEDDNCTYDPRRAQGCLDALCGAFTCEDFDRVWANDCSEVRYDCHEDTASF